MFPEILRIPGVGVTVWSYGFMLATAFGLGLWLTVRFAREDGLPPDTVYKIALLLIPSSLAGAQVMKLFDSGAGPAGAGSGSYLGGFLLALAVSVALAQVWSLPWRKSADAFAPALALGYALARIGCFLAGCCWGRPTNSWIGVSFTERAHLLTGVPLDQRLLPTQLIEAGFGLSILVGLLSLRRRRRFEGQIILAYLLWYTAARFGIEFWRDDPRGGLWGISASQFLCAILFLPALRYYIRLSRMAGAKKPGLHFHQSRAWEAGAP